MDSGLKQRLIGAAVLVALAVIFLPMLVQGPAPDSGVADLSMQMPAEPQGGYETRDLPLVTPGATSSQGLLGDDRQALPTVDTGSEPPVATGPGGLDPRAADPASDTAPPARGPMLPASTAGGDYAVSFGAYATRANAETVVARLRGETLPAFVESASVAGRPAWRVRIGPYASRADAEMARIAAGQVGPGVEARVVALDADATPAMAPASTARPLPPPSATTTTTTAALPAGTPAASKPVPLQTAAASSPTPLPSPSPSPSPAASKPVAPAAPPPAASAGAGFAVQLGAFAKGDEANALRDRLRAAGINAFTDSVQTDGGTLTRVKAGPVLSRAEADQLKTQVRGRFGIDGLVRTHP